MSYPKKQPVVAKTKPEAAKGSKLPDEKRDKLLAIQEREQLKGLLVNKFVEKYGKENKDNPDFVNKQVTEFMKNEKLTEENLKKLEQKIKNGPNAKPGADAASQKGSVKGGKAQYAEDIGGSAHHHSHAQQHRHQHDADDAYSVASSQKAKSVYVQGDSDDEWATMMKHDTALFKQEKELEKAREHEQRRKIRDELDRQVEEKRRLKEQDEEERKRYNGLVEGQLQNFDTKEKKKETEMQKKIMHEKVSRDKQLQDENSRRKLEQKNQKELDSLLVKRVQDEINEESRNAAIKRFEDKESLRKLLIENEEQKKKAAEEAKLAKQADVKAQQEYTRLIEKQEADRAAEIKGREDRAKKLMNMMADTVVKDQKEQIVADDKQLLKHVLDKESKDMEEDQRRLQRINDQKKEMRKFLDQQVEAKERRKQEDAQIEKRQAEIWKADTTDYNDREKKKAEYIKEVNLGHADFLKQQMEQENKKNKKMSTQEALLNKQKLKDLAAREEQGKFHKELVDPKKR